MQEKCITFPAALSCHRHCTSAPCSTLVSCPAVPDFSRCPESFPPISCRDFRERVHPMRLTHKAGLALALLTVGGFFTLPASAQNLVTNPGFETGDLTGCTSSGSVFLALGPHAGTYAAGFNSQSPPSRLSQNIPTAAENTYNVSCFLWNHDGRGNELQASFAGFQGVDVVNATPFNYK